MIQSYLKTGMVFYDSVEKQHFRRDCCKEDFCQFTDKDHFPSFQLITDSVLGLPVGVAWSVFDLNDTDLGVWGAVPPPMDTYHSGSYYQFTHDYRDAVTYLGAMDYETCYYLRLAINTVAGTEYWYSEAFRVCDCEVDGIGDGLNLIENGWFEDWSGAANPNNVPDGWFVDNNDATNWAQDDGDECRIVSDNTQAIGIRQIILTIGKWYVFSVEITVINSGGIQLYCGAVLYSWGTTGEKNYVFQATAINVSIRRHGVCNIRFTDARIEEFVGFEFCDLMTLNWWSDCDWDDIIYQYGYRNSLVLADPDKIELQTPVEDIVINPTERLGEMFVKDVVIKKRYMFKIRIPEYLWNALIRLPAYGSEMPNFHAWITLPDGSACPMSEVIIKGEWDTGNCFNTLEVEFVDDDEYPVVAGNCCKDEDVLEV